MNDTDDRLISVADGVIKLSRLLTKDRDNLPVSYLKDPHLRTAYVRYFLPANMMKIHLGLTELSLHPEGLLSQKNIRVLDLGAGPGTALLGILDFFAQQPARPSLTCVAVDRVSENLQIAEDLFRADCARKRLNATLRTVRADIESMDRIADGPFDLVIFSNVLNELFPPDEGRVAKRASLAGTILARNLADAGSCIMIEPALRETSRELLMVRDALLDHDFRVFSPCIRAGRCPACESPRDWCHEDIPWGPPDFIRRIDEMTGLRKDALKFSYIVMRKDNRSLSDLVGNESFRVVSEPLITKGKIEFYVCGVRGRRLITRLDKDESAANVRFEKLKRGAIVGFEGLHDEGTRFKVGPTTQVIIHRHAP